MLKKPFNSLYTVYTAILLCATSLTTLACVDVSVPKVTPPTEAELLVRVRAAQKGFLAAQGDTFRISLRATNLKGQLIEIAPEDSLVFISSNEDMVRVDADGLITAVKPTAGQLVTIVISLTKKSVTRLDTATIVVVPNPVSVASIKITPVDSTRLGVLSGQQFIRISAHDATGKKIPNLFIPIAFDRDFPQATGFIVLTTIVYSAADTAYRRSVLNFGFFGDLWLLASVNAFGTVLRDSVKFTGIYPSMQMITIDQHETLKTITSAQANQNFLLQPCGSVMFSNATAEQIDIIFDDPSAVNECVLGDETGNITALEPGGMAIRKFRDLATRTWTVRNAAGTVLTAVSGKVTTKNIP